jgi:hypothetical protein
MILTGNQSFGSWGEVDVLAEGLHFNSGGAEGCLYTNSGVSLAPWNDWPESS